VQPARFIFEHSPDVVWVTYTNDSIVPVARPKIEGDTLWGMRQGTQEHVAIPLDQVRSVQAKVRNAAKTALLATALGVTAVSALYVGFISKAGSGDVSLDCGRDAVTKHPEEHPECGS
jgi:hypothetical protein